MEGLGIDSLVSFMRQNGLSQLNMVGRSHSGDPSFSACFTLGETAVATAVASDNAHCEEIIRIEREEEELARNEKP